MGQQSPNRIVKMLRRGTTNCFGKIKLDEQVKNEAQGVGQAHRGSTGQGKTGKW